MSIYQPNGTIGKELADALLALGLPKSEHEVFMTVYELKDGVAAHFVADALDIPRSTAYSALNSLVDRGIVIRKKHSGTSAFMTSQKIIDNYIESRHATMRQAKEILNTTDKTSQDS
ncbi:MAG: hypothetical protein KGI49_00430 [Patescibacteria group bacterium]|nr:hypothetical protein [Patescibacteria group bacterium]